VANCVIYFGATMLILELIFLRLHINSYADVDN